MLIANCIMFVSIFLMIISSHPVWILTAIIIQTITICINLFILMNSSWFSYILFLIFLGGLMVIFVYIVSLASNEKFEFNIFTSSLILFSMTMMFLLWFNFFMKKNFEMNFNLIFKTMMIFSSNLYTPTLLIMFYLLFSLVVAVKISTKSEGPLRTTSS